MSLTLQQGARVARNSYLNDWSAIGIGTEVLSGSWPFLLTSKLLFTLISVQCRFSQGRILWVSHNISCSMGSQYDGFKLWICCLTGLEAAVMLVSSERRSGEISCSLLLAWLLGVCWACLICHYNSSEHHSKSLHTFSGSSFLQALLCVQIFPLKMASNIHYWGLTLF